MKVVNSESFGILWAGRKMLMEAKAMIKILQMNDKEWI